MSAPSVPVFIIWAAVSPSVGIEAGAGPDEGVTAEPLSGIDSMPVRAAVVPAGTGAAVPAAVAPALGADAYAEPAGARGVPAILLA